MIYVDANGARIPSLGFGTWDLRGSTAVDMVDEAIQCGYRHIDTAQRYENEREVGKGIAQNGINRNELFVTTKIWPDHFAPEKFADAARNRLDLLGLDHVDLLLLHWPSKERPLAETIELLNSARDVGIAKHIGVSNFTVAMINEAAQLSAAPLVCNQVEFHPYLSQDAVYGACRANGLAMTAYCPIARGKVINDEVILAIGKAHGKSAIQTTLRWLIQQDGIIAIPRTSSSERAAANADIFDFELTGTEMTQISNLGLGRERLVNLDIAPDWD